MIDTTKARVVLSNEEIAKKFPYVFNAGSPTSRAMAADILGEEEYYKNEKGTKK